MLLLIPSSYRVHMRKLEWLGYNPVKVAWWSTQSSGHNTSTWQTHRQPRRRSKCRANAICVGWQERTSSNETMRLPSYQRQTTSMHAWTRTNNLHIQTRRAHKENVNEKQTRVKDFKNITQHVQKHTNRQTSKYTATRRKCLQKISNT